MAVVVTEECISCNACEAECPNTAIYSADSPYTLGGQEFPALSSDHTYIAFDKCTECVGFNDEPACLSACPTEAIVKDPAHEETPEQLLAKKTHLDQVGR
jgi:ferredoxin